MRKVLNTMEQFHMVQTGDRVLVGVSGGSDSVALLHILKEFCGIRGISLFVVHVNHGLRAEAEEEAQYVEALARQWQLPFRCFETDVAMLAKKEHMSLEQAGHEARFACFEEATAEWNITKLALGHHQNDRAETMLMHLMHGCGPDGLTAMPPVEGMIIRPLIQTTKEELQQYCERNQLLYYTDSSNLEPGCLRNQIRLELLPHMKKYNPLVEEAITRLQDICGIEDEYLNSQTQAVWTQWGKYQGKEISFPLLQFREQHKAIQQRLLRHMMVLLTGTANGLSYRQIQKMIELTQHTCGSQKLFLKDGIRYIRQYDQIILRSEGEIQQEQYLIRWNKQGPVKVEQWPCMFTIKFTDQWDGKEDNLETIAVDAERLDKELLIRNRKSGDKVQPLGMQGHKSLKKYMIEKKLPADRRNRIPLIESYGEIIWIPGIFLADSVKITKKTKKIAILRYFPQ